MPTIVQPGATRPYATLEAGVEETLLSVRESIFVDLFTTHGAILLRGFDIDINTFRSFTEKYCSSSVFNESPDRKLLDEDANIQSVNFGAHPFPLHPELSREPWKPDICFFWCVNPPSMGGETTICDGVEIVKNMPPPVFRAFESRRLVYTLTASPEVLEYWLGDRAPDDEKLNNPPAHCPYTFYRENGVVVRSFSRPALHKPMFSDEPAFGNFLLFGRYLLGMKRFPEFDGGQIIPDGLVTELKKVTDRLTAPISWKKGDLVVLDNTRFMHGRNAIINPDEREIATYFGYLKFAKPDPEEPRDAFWRNETFRPPQKQVT